MVLCVIKKSTAARYYQASVAELVALPPCPKRENSMLRSNAILASLSPSDSAALQQYLRPVELQQKTVLYNTGDSVNHVYFPTTAVISLVVALTTGETTEAAMVGNDGAVGMASVLEGRIALNRAVVQLGGEAMVCSPAAFRSAVLQSEKLLGTVNAARASAVRAGPAIYGVHGPT
jgi:hypothetical protein